MTEFASLKVYCYRLLFAAFLFVLTATASAQRIKSYVQEIPGTDVRFKMIAIPAGSLVIGSPAGSAGREVDEGPQKNILLSAFWMGEKEVTFAEWDLFFKNLDLPQQKHIDGVSRPTAQYIDLTWGMGRNPGHPANSMSQQAAMAYCKWLYDKTGVFYRLPTEAEWEYACRAGNSAAYPFGNDLSQLREYGYFKDNSEGKFQETGKLKPNAWGLYDILGNLSEWTLDQYVENSYSSMKMKDPMNVPTKRYPRVARGGSYMDDEKELRCSNRIPSQSAWNQRDPQIPKSKWWLTDGMFVGFRLVRPMKTPAKEEIERFYEAFLDK
jgi:formylglycine-generating enzyme required for sulfatase activity